MNKSIVIMGRTYPINFVPTNEIPIGSRLDFTNFFEASINIDAKLKGDSYCQQIMMRSILECIGDQMSLHIDHSEYCVLASALSRVFADNKGLAQYLAGIEDVAKTAQSLPKVAQSKPKVVPHPDTVLKLADNIKAVGELVKANTTGTSSPA